MLFRLQQKCPCKVLNAISIKSASTIHIYNKWIDVLFDKLFCNSCYKLFKYNFHFTKLDYKFLETSAGLHTGYEEDVN